MDFEWDEAKSERNKFGRGLSIPLAHELFARPVVEHVDSRRNYREVRIKAVGILQGKVLVRVYTDRGKIRRIISLRYASRRERDAYRAP